MPDNIKIDDVVMCSCSLCKLETSRIERMFVVASIDGSMVKNSAGQLFKYTEIPTKKEILEWKLSR